MKLCSISAGPRGSRRLGRACEGPGERAARPRAEALLRPQAPTKLKRAAAGPALPPGAPRPSVRSLLPRLQLREPTRPGSEHHSVSERPPVAHQQVSHQGASVRRSPQPQGPQVLHRVRPPVRSTRHLAHQPPRRLLSRINRDTNAPPTLRHGE